METICAGCKKILPRSENLTRNDYDLECTNVSSTRIYSTVTKERTQAWKCQLCLCKIPKADNTNTPARPQQSVVLPLDDTNNINQRKKIKLAK